VTAEYRERYANVGIKAFFAFPYEKMTGKNRVCRIFR